MREACLYNNWSFFPIFLKIYRAFMRWTPWIFFLGGGGGEESPRWGHSPSWVEGRGMRALSQILSDESLSSSLKHISTGEHSLHISRRGTDLLHLYFLFSSNGNMFRVTGFCAGNSPMTAGNSPVTCEFSSHRPVTRSFDVFFDLRLNKGLSKQSRHLWFETPSLSLWRHCNVVPNSDPVIRAAVGSFGVQRATIVQFWIGETGQIGVGGWSVHYGRNGLKFGTLLYPDSHSLKLTIFCTQRQLKFVVYELVLSWGENKWNIRSL